MKNRYIKQIVFLVLLLSVSLTCLMPNDDNCFTVIVGKAASDGGVVLLAHNEDDAGKNLFVNVHRLPAVNHLRGEIVKLRKGAVLPQVVRTIGFLWLQMPGVEFGDSYLNRKGVVIASNSCASREDRPELTDGGIGFMLRRLLAERAPSAREAVEMAGRLIETYGYYSSGRSYAVADSKEGWLLQVVKGKHWIAQRVPDDQVAVVANCYTIGAVNLKDKKNFLGSGDIVDYAVARGWYAPDRDGEFNFARVYSAPGNIKNEKNSLRQWRGINLLAKKKYKMEPQFPFVFPPRKDVRLTDLFRVLRDHYEDTEYDLTDDYKKGSPNFTKNRTICTKTTRYSFAAELREEVPLELAHRIWISFRRPDSNAYCPWYASIPAAPDGYTRGSSHAALYIHFKLPGQFFAFNPDYAYWHFDKLSQLVDKDYKPRIKMVRKEWQNFENYTLKRLKKTEKEFQYFLTANKKIALKIITNYIYKLEYRRWLRTTELIHQLEK